jgi:signal transduction histidine kinase/ActR/RegA family two-component response regulator
MDVSEMTLLHPDSRFVSALTGGTLLDPERQSSVGFAPELTERGQAETAHAARRVAEMANRAKSEFLTTLSHELRTPLNAMLGYAQLLSMDSGLNERQRRSLQTIRASGEYLLSLIVDILDLSRIEAQRFELTPTPVELEPFLRSVVDVMRAKADEKGLILALDVAPGLPAVVLVDQRRLRQVLLNLLGNAVKFTDSGTVSLCVSDEGRDDDHSRVRIDVRDTGVGMRPEDIPIVFEPFEQVGDVSRREGGTGLGLTITRALVGAMGGDIRVASELGRGTEFSFSLRLKHADTRDRPASTRGSPARCLGLRRRVLVIDDVDHNRSMLADFLTSAGFEIQVAKDGLQGIDKVQSFLPDLIVMDSVMPVMSGLEATRRLRADPAHTHLPIIAVSANATEEHRRDCLQAGANLCFSKPVRLDELACAIQQLLQLAPRPRTGE